VEGGNRVNLETWICWAFRPISRGRHHLQSKTLVKQAVRDLGGPIDHAAFCAAMVRAGFRVVHRHGDACYFDCTDSAEKRKYYQQKFLNLDEGAVHPLLKHGPMQPDPQVADSP
jgi:hypothetical protein